MNFTSWSRSRLVGGTVAAIVVIALTLQFGVASRPQPAMWVVRDEDSTVYLLGTFHMVKPGTQWRSDKIVDAFAASDELWLETSDLAGAQAQEIMLRVGFDYDRPLSSRLSPEAKARLDSVARQLGLEPADLDPMRPWMAAMSLSMMQMMRDGYDLMAGVDQVLEDEANAAHKPIVDFATPEEHLMILAGLPEAVELEYLTQTLLGMEMQRAMMDDMTKAWADGDVETLDRVVVASMKQTAPAFYEEVVIKRNRVWVERIAERMQGSGTSFIAVGTAHLVGPDALTGMLAARGLEVERY